MEQETVFVIMLKNKETGFLEKETQIKKYYYLQSALSLGYF